MVVTCLRQLSACPTRYLNQYLTEYYSFNVLYKHNSFSNKAYLIINYIERINKLAPIIDILYLYFKYQKS